MRLHCHATGHGPPLVLLHGLFGSFSNWLGVSHAFARRFTVLAVDQRNHGRSPHADEMSYVSMAGDLAEFLDTHGLQSAHLLGHSMGGKVAMQFALSHPARVKRLVVVDMAPRAMPPQHRAVIEALVAVDPAAYRSRSEMDAALAGRLPDVALRRFLLKNLTSAPSGELRWQVNLSAIHANYGQLMAAVTGGRPFTRPTLFVRGEHSDYLTAGDTGEIERLFPNAQLRTVRGAGHWVHAEAPAEFASVVTEFLSAT
ncbi:MAG TPA: alpha/beta fold hydrolase [Verrucomicrobiae bacterium]